LNPRELLARLNVPAVRYEVGRGGIPELTNIDVAGALGMVRDRFDRELFTAIWWPDGFQLARGALAEEVRQLLLKEYAKREREYTAARLELHMVECELEARRRRTEFDRKILHDQQNKLDAARGARWPWNSELYANLFTVVVEELKHPQKCAVCQGRGQMRNEKGLVHDCKKCSGTGVKHETKTWRAKSLGLEEHQYRHTWHPVYLWLYGRLAKHEARAAASLYAAINEDVEAV
jgi:hypothetical protein